MMNPQRREPCQHRALPTWDRECGTWRCPECGAALRVTTRGEAVEEVFW